ncbi:MAG: hypothetical protein IPM94_06230 [bacterium]|nr:hypothetical protein [bacterium]
MMSQAPRIARMFTPLLLLATALCGCDDSSPHSPRPCTAQYVPGIEVMILDAETRLPTACGATVWLTDGGYQEQAADLCVEGLPDSLQYSMIMGAYEREGVYTVVVTKAGYEPWTMSSVQVAGDECHVFTQRLVAFLKRDPLESREEN